MPTLDLSILILAGGQSSRMGQDKALMLWDGTPLLTRVCDVAQDLSCPTQILSPWPDRYETIVPPSVDRYLEQSPGKGPLWALNDGLTHHLSLWQSHWVLLLACDMPDLKAARLRSWGLRLSSLPETCLAYVPQTPVRDAQSSRWEPLCGFYRTTCQPSLKTFLAQGGQSFQRWLDQIDAIAIPITSQDHAMFYNCNTPQDLTPPSS